MEKMCSTLAFLFAAIITVAADETQKCEDGWTALNGQCYFLSDIQLKWPDARSDCQQRGGDLVVINDEPTNDMIKAFKATRSNNVWIGLSDQSTEGFFQWVNGQPLCDYGNWIITQPDDYESKEDCMEYAYGGWNDDQCQRLRSYVCQKKATESGVTGGDQTCDVSWTELNGFCYYVSNTQASWDDARSDCQQMGGDLAVIRDKATDDLIKGFFDKKGVYLWIGSNDRTEEGRFQWVDGQEVGSCGYTDWSSNQPDNYNDWEDCVEFWHGGWNDANCEGGLRFYVCQKEQAEEPSTATYLHDSTTAAPHGFRCSDGHEIPLAWICDRILDCFHGDDELMCDLFW